MATIKEPGVYTGKVIDGGFGLSKNKGTPFVTLEIVVSHESHEIDGAKVWADVYLPEGNDEMCQRNENVLAHIGWDRDYETLDDMKDQLNGNSVEFEMKVDSYNGKTRLKVDSVWIPGQPPTRSGLRKEVIAPDQKAAFVARMKAMRAQRGGAKSEDEIPF